MARLAASLEDVSKRYVTGAHTPRYGTLREALAERFGNRSSDRSRRGELWALRQVDLEIQEGEVLGVVGRNGAGKTTLLRLLARITRPTTGIVRTKGRVGALLDVGTGFHPELSGRDNVFLSGAILGMTRRDIEGRLDEIVAFAGVEEFLETPVKRYSSGMYLRLAFSVAAHLPASVLVVDEALAVGDVEFQQRCIGKIGTFGREGRTVVFVSHDLGAVAQLCTRSVWLDRGSIQADGRTPSVIDSYRAAAVSPPGELVFSQRSDTCCEILSLEITDDEGRRKETIRRGEEFELRLRIHVEARLPDLDLGFTVTNQRGVRLLEDYWADTRFGEEACPGHGDYEASVRIPGFLPSGQFLVGLYLGTTYEILFQADVMSLEVLPRPEDRQELAERSRVVHPALSWHVTALPGK